MKISKLREIIRESIKEAAKEGNFDSRFKKAMSGAGFSDKEQDDIMSRDVGSSFPDTDVMKDFDEDDVRSIEDKAMKSDSQR